LGRADSNVSFVDIRSGVSTGYAVTQLLLHFIPGNLPILRGGNSYAKHFYSWGIPAIANDWNEAPPAELTLVVTQGLVNQSADNNESTLYGRERFSVIFVGDLHRLQLSGENPIRYNCSSSCQQSKGTGKEQNDYRYFLISCAPALVGIALVAISVYCVSYAVDASAKDTYNPLPLQLIAFVLFLCGIVLFIVGTATLIDQPLLYYSLLAFHEPSASAVCRAPEFRAISCCSQGGF
jgi:hypothetical protein